MNSALVTTAPTMDAFTSRNCPGGERRQRDHQLGQVAERRVEQAADDVAGRRGDRLGRPAEQRRERHDGEDREHEQQDVRVGRAPLGGEEDRTKTSSQSSGLWRISAE